MLRPKKKKGINNYREKPILSSVRLASFRWQELYLGLYTELGKLPINDRLILGYQLKDSLLVKGKYTIDTLER